MLYAVQRGAHRANPRTGRAETAGRTPGQVQGPPGVTAAMRYLTWDPRCRPARAGYPTGTATRPLALATGSSDLLPRAGGHHQDVRTAVTVPRRVVSGQARDRQVTKRRTRSPCGCSPLR